MGYKHITLYLYLKGVDRMLKCDLMKNGECICNQKCYKLIAYEEGYKDGYKDGTENIITNIFDEDNVIVTQKREID